MKAFSRLKLKRIKRFFERLPLGFQVAVLALISLGFVLAGLGVSYWFVTRPIDCGYDVHFSKYCHSHFVTRLYRFSGFFGEHLRGHLFAGYISLGAFLLSLKTFIIIGMKKNVYDSEAYKDFHDRQMRNKHGEDYRLGNKMLYAPLVELSDFIYFAIIFSLLAAIAQVSVGLIDHYYAALFCLWLVIFATLLLFNCLRLIKMNIDIWIKR